MTLSDFLMLISIGVAVITMSEANNKKIWRYKFSKWSLVGVGVALLWILYLIKYPSFRVRGFYFPLFERENSPASGTWAFIVSLSLLIFIAYKIVFQKTFPKSRHDDLISYYRSLGYSDFNLLLSYIDYYHNPSSLFHLVKAVLKLKMKRKMDKTLSSKVMREVVYDHYFIEQVVKVSPALFLEHTASFYASQDDDTITANEYFATCLAKDFNYKFYDALEFAYKKCNGDGTSKMIDAVSSNPILKHLFKDNEYFTHVQIIHVFYEEAKKELNTHNSVFDRDYKGDGFENHYHSVFYQYLLLYTITFEHIFDTLHNSKGKASKNTHECIRSIYELNPSFLSLYTEKKDAMVTFRDGLYDEIRSKIFDLVYYCEQHNYPDRIYYALIHWLQLFHPGIEIGNTKEDLDRLFGIILDVRYRWPNCFSAIWNLICELNNKHNKHTLQ